MKHFFTAGIFALMGLVSFAGAFFLKHILPKNLNVSCTLLLVAIVLVKMLEVRDGIFG